MSKFSDLMDALEKIPTNVHAAFLILVGAALVALKHAQEGQSLLMAGAAIFSHKPN